MRCTVQARSITGNLFFWMNNKRKMDLSFLWWKVLVQGSWPTQNRGKATRNFTANQKPLHTHKMEEPLSKEEVAIQKH
ncbi:hypothetical protein GUJ93_ZPchr0002g23884 [Zizania palustris]|uniref:Uncharacterized protein n=1 Tax=Zizania palustris TaxID=103762 RepID=A0A8J5RVE3_ZIZPA|nr:hypothetical protein GUJ93_ZPchr0002g23884 [Zizania palustris]